MGSLVKEEIVESPAPPRPIAGAAAAAEAEAEAAPSLAPADAVIELSSSDSDSDPEEEGGGGGVGAKRPRVSGAGAEAEAEGARPKRPRAKALPIGFLDPLPPEAPPPLPLRAPSPAAAAAAIQGSKQFWKAGDYDGSLGGVDSTPMSGAGMDHVRVHPKFLHSNATSHKWALGALAELLDNALDEVCNGATYVNIDMLNNNKGGSRMLLVEDNGGGMDPDKMRQCMSLGYSAKCKMASTIGQYGNGFKTSTMRLGADVIVFSRSRGKDGKRPTQSIGMLSYTFLRSTGKEDIVVPMLDYEKEKGWNQMTRTTPADWNTNLETIIKWSPYSSEADLLQQFSSLKDQGTRIVIYNLWEDDQGELELDFYTDKHDIQVRGANREEKNIQMAKQFPNSKHFLTYRHSLRSYASILYLRLPHFFRMILRGKEVEHHNIVNDMMHKQEVTYRPQYADGHSKDPNMVAVVTIGFVKDAKHHIDVQGFNVYHKNRLIKPFWRVWTAAGSGGRGVIGVLEANFVEPAHDKQDFERTTILSRLEARLVQMQKSYWSTNSHKVGYVQFRNKKDDQSDARESSPEAAPHPSSHRSGKGVSPASASNFGKSKDSAKVQQSEKSIYNLNQKNQKGGKSLSSKFNSAESSQSQLNESSDESDPEFAPSERFRSRSHKTSPAQKSFQKGSRSPAQKSFQKGSRSSPLPSRVRPVDAGAGVNNSATSGAKAIEGIATRSKSKLQEVKATCNGKAPARQLSPELTIQQLKDENLALKEKISKMESSKLRELQIEKDRNKSLTEQLEDANRKLEHASSEQEALIDIFSEERTRRDKEEENLRKKLKEASATIQDLMDKLSACRKKPKQ
ncbi:MORC family CW-type zinc finger protein 3 [Ananas comosus]|uniref:MORC family CW-type zinc finger protein 3 n=1 Tax=Ananas comosus TaxID=4615 RepID=A0A199UUL5_ANACO|nr:MORC family CW-type zinc finger protein 3 [Ananas comosus]